MDSIQLYCGLCQIKKQLFCGKQKKTLARARFILVSFLLVIYITHVYGVLRNFIFRKRGKNTSKYSYLGNKSFLEFTIFFSAYYDISINSVIINTSKYSYMYQKYLYFIIFNFTY